LPGAVLGLALWHSSPAANRLIDGFDCCRYFMIEKGRMILLIPLADDSKGHVLRYALADHVPRQSGASVVALTLPHPGQQVGQPLGAVLLTVTSRRRVGSEETHQMR